MSGTRSVRRGGAARLLLLTLVAGMLWSAAPAGASELPESEAVQGSAAEEGSAEWAPRQVGRMPVKAQAYMPSLWTWPAGNRGFALSGVDDIGYANLDAYDLQTLEQIGSQELNPRGFATTAAPTVHYGNGAPATIAIDEAGGRLFVAHSGISLAKGDRIAGAGGLATGGSYACADSVNNGSVLNCVGGIHVLDAGTLAPVRPPVPLRAVRPETAGLKAVLRAMSYAPPRPGRQENGKVLMLIEDWVAAGTTTAPAAMPRFFGFNTVYAVQLDPTTGEQDWAIRLNNCNGARETPTNQLNTGERYDHPSAIFRSAAVATPAVFVACHTGTSQTATILRIPLDAEGNATALPVRMGAGHAADVPETLGGQASSDPAPYMPESTFPGTALGPTNSFRMIADPVRERFLIQSVYGGAEVWWVFDTAEFAFIGTIGIGPIGEVSPAGGRPAFDPASGRLYVQGAVRPGSQGVGGLFITDTGVDPLPQALVFPDGWPVASVTKTSGFLAVVPPREGKPPLLLAFKNGAWQVFEDRVPLGSAAAGEGPDDGSGPVLTLDVDEVEGVTQSSFDGTARGYGARAVLVGGLEAAGRMDRFDPGWWYQPWGFPSTGGVGGALNPRLRDVELLTGVNQRHPCSQSNRELVLAFAGPEGDVVVDGSGSRGSAQPVRFDSGTQADTDLPVSRCGWMEWSRYWNVGLFGRPPVDEPSLPTQALRTDIAECVSTDDTPSATVGDAVGSARAAQATCAGEEASGFGYVRGATIAGNNIGEALSSFRVYRDPGRGIVARVDSVARGISLGGQVTIDTVRGSAESWANGRRQPVPDTDREPGYSPNCDLERSAGTCYRRHIFGVTTPGYRCGPCGDEQALTDGLSRAMGVYGQVRLRDPDPQLAKGSPDGYQAAILKPQSERFTDAAINNDFLTTIIPALEIVRYAPPAPPDPGNSALYVPVPGARGLQVYQFAGVAVSSSYSILCLLVYDAATNICGAGDAGVAGLTVNLTDPAGTPLAGGAFEIRRDVDTDGVAGLADTLIPDGACLTAADGTGTCRFDNLQPGAYLITQVAAPPGYGKAAEPYLVELASGEARTVTFHNTSNVSTITVTATDDTGKPLPDATFAVYPDPDSDGKIAAGTAPAATCTTNTAGTCSMRVPAGSYVLAQTGTPDGLTPIEPVAFTFATGGQTAAVGITNYPTDTTIPQPDPMAGPVYTPPAHTPPVETVNDYTPTTVDTPQVSVPEQIGGTIVRIVKAPGDALRLLTRTPQQAAALTATLLLLTLAYAAIHRQTTLRTLTRP